MDLVFAPSQIETWPIDRLRPYARNAKAHGDDQVAKIAALAAGMILLSGCAAVGSDARPGACPPVVGYSRAEQARVAEEVAVLPEGAMTAEWLADYAVLREQIRASRCKRPGIPFGKRQISLT